MTENETKQIDHIKLFEVPNFVNNSYKPFGSSLNHSLSGLDYGPIFDDLSPSQSSTQSSSGTVDKYEMVWWAQFGWTTAFSLMLTVAIGGNIIVIWIVTAHRRMRSVTNYFLVNLSIADLLMSVLNCLFNFIYMVRRDWQFGELYCKISNFIATVTVAASVFTLTGISCDRYLAIVHPLQPHLSKKKALSTIVLIWVISMLLGTPCLLYSAIVSYRFQDRVRTSCVLIWPDGLPTVSQYDYAYQIIIIITTYFIPMILMICSYSAMGKVLWGTRSIGEMTQRQMDSIRSKRKIVRMFIIVVIIFGVCWLPYHVYFIYTHYNRTILYSTYVQHVYLLFYWFAMANAMVNPIIYYWMNARFRKYFNMFLCGWTKLLVKTATIKTDTMEPSNPADNVNLAGASEKENGQFHLTHNCRNFIKPLIISNTSSVLQDSIKRTITDDIVFSHHKSSLILKHSNSV